MTNHALTLSLMGHLVSADETLWTIVEVDMDGGVLLRREWDDPRHDRSGYFSDDPADYKVLGFPGVAYHKRFPGSVLVGEIQRKWVNWGGW